MTKYLLNLIILLAIFSSFSVSPVQAQTRADLLSDLEALTEQVARLQAEVNERKADRVNDNRQSDFDVPELECLELNQTLRYGMADAGDEDEDITALQEFLIATGDYSYPSPTGYFGLETREAVQRFQTKMGISTTAGIGVVEATTADRIEMISCASDISPTIDPAYLASGRVGQSYQESLSLTGASHLSGALRWVVVTGSLPAGMTLSQGGLLSGRSAAPGAYEFVIRAVTSGYAPIAERKYQLIINDADGMLYGA